MGEMKAAWPCKDCGGAAFLDYHEREHPADLPGLRIICARCGKGLAYTRQFYANDQIARWNRLFGKEPDAATDGSRAPKPECRTCPLWCPATIEGHPDTMACHDNTDWLTYRDGDRVTPPDWFCPTHPLYPAWASEELQRRLAAKE